MDQDDNATTRTAAEDAAATIYGLIADKLDEMTTDADDGTTAEVLQGALVGMICGRRLARETLRNAGAARKELDEFERAIDGRVRATVAGAHGVRGCPIAVWADVRVAVIPLEQRSDTPDLGRAGGAASEIYNELSATLERCEASFRSGGVRLAALASMIALTMACEIGTRRLGELGASEWISTGASDLGRKMGARIWNGAEAEARERPEAKA